MHGRAQLLGAIVSAANHRGHLIGNTFGNGIGFENFGPITLVDAFQTRGRIHRCANCRKEGKNAIKWTRLSCRKFRNNAVRLQLHGLAYNLGNFMRTLALPKDVEHR